MVMGRDYHREYSRNYYHRRKNEYLKLLGGKCVRCGATENLQFDHIDRKTKLFTLGRLLSKTKAAALEELKKCQILCFWCHVDKSKPEISETNRLRARRVGRAVEGTRPENEQT